MSRSAECSASAAHRHSALQAIVVASDPDERYTQANAAKHPARLKSAPPATRPETLSAKIPHAFECSATRVLEPHRRHRRRSLPTSRTRCLRAPWPAAQPPRSQEPPCHADKISVNVEFYGSPPGMENAVSHYRRGFTLIELIAVIVVLSVLAVVALPRFLDSTDQAHDATMHGINGAFNAAAVSARAQWLADGQTGSTVTFDGNTLPVSVNGWPTPVAGTTDCSDLWRDLLQNPPRVVPFAAPLVADDGLWAFTVTNPTVSLCLYIYRPPYPTRLMWIAYYAHHATLPAFNGRIITSGF